MAALGKGNGRAAGGVRRRRALVAIAALSAFLLAANVQSVKASQDPLFPLQWNLQ